MDDDDDDGDDNDDDDDDDDDDDEVLQLYEPADGFIDAPVRLLPSNLQTAAICS